MAEKEKKKRHSAHQTQWAAQFAVASELCKRGYQIAFTMGNHPQIDLMVISPKGKSFDVDVKGLYKPNFWVVRPKQVKDGLFYVFAYVPSDEANQFFIMTHEQVTQEIKNVIKRIRARGRRADENTPMLGVQWGASQQYKNAWSTLPE